MKRCHIFKQSQILLLLAILMLFLHVISQFHSLEEVLGIVGFSCLRDVLIDGEVEDRNQEVQIRQTLAPAGVVVPEMFVFLVYAPYFR